MATDPLVRSDISAEPSEAEYQAFCDTVMATGRGRWFLAEHARRHRKATTQDALDTLSRIEGRLRIARDPAAAHVFEELRSLAATIHHARLDIGWSDSEFSKGAKVMALLELLEDRIAGLLDDGARDVPLASEDKAEPRVQLTVIAANPLPPRPRAELPAIDFTAEATVVALPQPAVFAAERTQAETVRVETVHVETVRVDIARIDVAIAAEPPASTLAFPAVAMFQPFEVEKAAPADVAAPLDFEAEPFDAEAIAPEVFAAPVIETAAETAAEAPAVTEPSASAPAAGDVELFDMPAVESAPEPAPQAILVDAEPAPEPAPSPAARRQLPPGYDPMTPVRALSADERIALVS